MVFIGICVKKMSDGINMYSQPFILNHDNLNSETFIAQIIRDISFSFYALLNEQLEISIISYPNKNSYSHANKNNYYAKNFNVLGKYNVVFDKFDEQYNFNDCAKGTLKKILDENYNLELVFSVFKDNSEYNKNNKNNKNIEDKYIFSTPSITGSSEYIK